MNPGTQLKYGWLRGGKVSVPVAMAASQQLVAASGRFIYMNAGAATLCVDGTSTIFGGIESEAETPSTSEEKNCVIDLTAVFRIPVNSGTYAVGMVGDLCDISVSSTIQGAQLDASTENLLCVIAGDTTNNAWCDVMMDPDVWGTGLGVDA